MATITAITNREAGTLVGQSFHLFQGLCQNVTVIVVPVHGADADHKTFLIVVAMLPLAPNS